MGGRGGPTGQTWPIDYGWGSGSPLTVTGVSVSHRTTPFRYAFGGRVRDLRRAACMTQVQLAQAWNSNPVTISKIENGRMNPGVWGLPALAKALGATLTDLVDGLD